jgi:hypothetical protein|tara:strand:+ start:899 stop:1120 length:222 start_codon:yes stop_codon:yes gene_type:complete
VNRATTNVLKVAEGGPSRDFLKMDAEDLGLKVRFEPSCYVGHVAVVVESRLKRPIKKFYKAQGWDEPWIEEVY